MECYRLRCCLNATGACLVLLLTLLLGCGPAVHTPRAPARVSDKALMWTMHAAEYRATTRTVFAAAAGVLAELLANQTWTAALEQSTDAASGKPPAVIVDVDDTLLGSSAYQWQLARQGQSYEQDSWDAWTRRAEPSAVPGAVEYVKHATALKVAVFYVTNRSCRARAGSGTDACPQASETQASLVQAGFPQPQPGHLLLRGMRPEWRADKSSRRGHVASSYRILQLIGDDLNDFVAAAPDTDREQRNQLVAKHRTFWGRGWFMLPNPMYGSWQAHLRAPGPKR